jgi:hypothetical protein
VTNLTPSCVYCLEIWEPQPPGTLSACIRPAQGLLYPTHLCQDRLYQVDYTVYYGAYPISSAA